MSEIATTKDIAWARRITERLRIQGTNFQEARDKIISTLHEAQDGGAWELLGYASWSAYISDVFGEEPLRLERDPRREFVAELADEGMSTRAIAPLLGVSHMTVATDLQKVGVNDFTTTSDVEPETPAVVSPVSAPSAATPEDAPEPVRKVTGLDGKQYSAPKPQQESKPRQHPLPDQFFRARYDMSRKVESLERLADDQRFTTNKEKVAQENLNDLNHAIEALQRIVASLQN